MSQGRWNWTSREARAARREAYWNRPKHPRDWRYWVGGTGRVLIVIGLLMFGFVAYQLWGTGLQFAQAQNRLDDDLEELFAQAGVSRTDSAAPAANEPSATSPPAGSVPSSGPASAAPASTTTPATGSSPSVPVPALTEGQGFAWLDIPDLGLDDLVVVAGVRPSSLEDGPGHYPGTPMPGQLGNASIAGHRTTYGQPFFRLDELEPGDEIIVTTVQGTFVYVVTGSEIVPPDRGDVVLTTDPDVARLTLTTCDPKYTATNRLIVRADLDPTAGTGAQPADLSYGAELGASTPDAAAPATLPGEEVTGVTDTSTPDATTPGVTAPAGTIPADTIAANSTPADTTPADTTPADTIAADSTPAGPTASGPGSAPDVPTPAEVEDAFALGWFDDTAAWPHVAGWGLLTAAVAALGYLVARLLRRRWVGWVGAAVPFAVTLYFFYENVNRLLPPAL